MHISRPTNKGATVSAIRTFLTEALGVDNPNEEDLKGRPRKLPDPAEAAAVNQDRAETDDQTAAELIDGQASAAAALGDEASGDAVTAAGDGLLDFVVRIVIVNKTDFILRKSSEKL